jgi:uncharacterized protein YcaQ
VKSTTISLAQARRIAVRAQALDGSAKDALETVRRLGFLQIDPISSIATPQQLVLWSRLGRYDPADLDRLLWEERKLFEWNAFIWPIEDLPLIRARMRRRRNKYVWDHRGNEFLRRNDRFRRYVLRELERRGPLLSRELEADLMKPGEPHEWWGSRKVTLMLELLQVRGIVAVVGRRGKQRVWDLSERWYPPETEKVSLVEAEKILAEKRFRAQGVRFEKGEWRIHPDAEDGAVQANRVTFLSPFDRLIHDRARLELLWDYRYRLEMYVPKAKRQYGYYVLPILRGDRLIGRIDPVFDRKAGVLQINGVWWEPGVKPVPLDRTIRSLAKFVGADTISA